jgi:hypothetical protein
MVDDRLGRAVQAEGAKKQAAEVQRVREQLAAEIDLV